MLLSKFNASTKIYLKVTSMWAIEPIGNQNSFDKNIIIE